MKKKALQVSIHVTRPSLVELAVGDKVQLDRLMPCPDGYLAERCGDLLSPGITALALERGNYCFRTLAAAHLKVIHGGVDTFVSAPDPKDPWPKLPPVVAVPSGRGDDAKGEPPSFTVELTTTS